METAKQREMEVIDRVAQAWNQDPSEAAEVLRQFGERWRTMDEHDE